MNKVTLTVDGMKCGMCESHVEESIRKVSGVKKVKASHLKNNAIVICMEDTSMEDIVNSIQKQGYKVLQKSVEPYVKKGLFPFLKRSSHD